jgi:hypothetical protein
LRIFHESVGEPYGDFQPANLLIRDAGAVFLDPTVPNPANPAYSASPEMQFAPSSVDLGYWLYSVAVSTPGLLLRHPRLAARRGDFACALAVEAAATIEAAATAHDDSERFIAEVGRVARRHLRWLAQNGGLRDRTLSLLGAVALAQLTRRIVRLSSAR